MKPRHIKVFALLLGLAGTICLTAGIAEFAFSFKTGRWYFPEPYNPTAARIAGVLLIAAALVLAQWKPKE